MRLRVYFNQHEGKDVLRSSFALREISRIVKFKTRTVVYLVLIP